MMMGPRPMMPMPGMSYHMAMSMPMGSIPAGSQAPSMGIKASPAAWFPSEALLVHITEEIIAMSSYHTS